jgi:hypothetical protein
MFSNLPRSALCASLQNAAIAFTSALNFSDVLFIKYFLLNSGFHRFSRLKLLGDVSTLPINFFAGFHELDQNHSKAF